MARKYRIETNDGFYHIINRGNYRKSIFAEAGCRSAFERTLYEAVEKSKWELLSYVLMKRGLKALKVKAGELGHMKKQRRRRWRLQPF